MAKMNFRGGVYQLGKETTAGTAVAATARLTCPRIEFDEAQTVREHSDAATGSMIGVRGPSILTRRGTTFQVPEYIVPIEELPYFFAMSVAAATSSVEIASSGTYTHAYVRPSTTVGDFDTYTMEARLGGSASKQIFETSYGCIDSFTISGSRGQALRLTATGLARKADRSVAITGSLEVPTTLTYIPMNRGTVSIAASYADMVGESGTYVAVGSSVVNFSHTFNGGQYEEHVMAGRDDLDADFIDINPANTSSSTTMRTFWDSSDTAFAYEKGWTESVSGTPTWYKLEFELDEAAGSQNYKFSIINYGMIQIPRLNEVDENGISAVDLAFTNEDDLTSGVPGNFIYSLQLPFATIP